VKTMTCRQLGEVCDLEHQGKSPDDVIKVQDRHLKEARDAMKGRWRHPKMSIDWYRDMKAKFADLPES